MSSHWSSPNALTFKSSVGGDVAGEQRVDHVVALVEGRQRLRHSREGAAVGRDLLAPRLERQLELREHARQVVVVTVEHRQRDLLVGPAGVRTFWSNGFPTTISYASSKA